MQVNHPKCVFKCTEDVVWDHVGHGQDKIILSCVLVMLSHIRRFPYSLSDSLREVIAIGDQIKPLC